MLQWVMFLDNPEKEEVFKIRDYVIGILAVQAGMALATLTGLTVQTVSYVAIVEYSPSTTTLGLATITVAVE